MEKKLLEWKASSGFITITLVCMDHSDLICLRQRHSDFGADPYTPYTLYIQSHTHMQSGSGTKKFYNFIHNLSY